MCPPTSVFLPEPISLPFEGILENSWSFSCRLKLLAIFFSNIHRSTIVASLENIQHIKMSSLELHRGVIYFALFSSYHFMHSLWIYISFISYFFFIFFFLVESIGLSVEVETTKRGSDWGRLENTTPNIFLVCVCTSSCSWGAHLAGGFIAWTSCVFISYLILRPFILFMILALSFHIFLIFYFLCIRTDVYVLLYDSLFMFVQDDSVSRCSLRYARSSCPQRLIKAVWGLHLSCISLTLLFSIH